ncbi:type II toxin-antitoxin system YhaV family toxin [Sneathiella sp.]|uniref:type II toxin-antitoxin system YhaV family toxin n=1 Tax=Sneathiella sp. TaxID=1964365 RepID=UPI0026224210|nr:type II toxin-antitoxin system YhaV family toxin [Sneathiella sp.]MDF2367454.1 type II toxin-antitoxin system YhaV family toxin [Sneathiella sp.]
MTKPVAPLVVNGWSIFAHSVFLEQIDGLIEEVETRKIRDPKNWKKKNCTKRLAAILKLVTEVIPTDPTSDQFRQGHTLGSARKHWFRAKFFQQYRLFFRFDSTSKIIVLAWVNDEKSLRAYGSKTDAYKIFKEMLDKKNPPDDFDMLLKDAAKSAEQFAAALKTEPLSDPAGK